VGRRGAHPRPRRSGRATALAHPRPRAPHPTALTDRTFGLDAAGRHRWSPIAPDARVEVTLERPDLRWSGHGYFDTNAGARPLEDDFSIWNWSRAKLKRGSAVLYAVEGRPPIAIRIDPSGAVEAFEPPARAALPPTPLWRMPRETRADPAAAARVARTLEDSPFYSRSVIETRVLGETATAMHESCRWRASARPGRS
jgi:carotenoid 1,2-hydratase